MWNEIELLTSDDTGNGCLSIGSREEHGTALYQVDTLVKISSSEKVSLNPQLHACNSSHGCTVIADQSVTLLDSSCQALRLHLQFGTQVDVVGLCQEGEFLLVGERSGNLHLIHVATKQILLTNALVQKAPDETQSTYRDLIIEKNDEGLYHVFLLTRDGFFCIMDLHLGEIQKAIQKMDLNMAKELQGRVKTCFISTENYHTSGCLNFVIGDLTSEIQMIIGGTGDCVLSKWEQDSHKLVTVKSLTDSSMIKGAKKFQLIDNMLFILDTENVLSLWDAYTLTPIWNWPSVHIEEFLLTTEADSPSSVTWQGITSNLKLIALTTPNDKQMRYLMVYSLPTMNLLYSLQVSDVASLVKSGVSTDTIYLLEGIYENDKSSESSVSVLVLRCLTEALPENRLSRLLHKRKFAEAENFAIQFGLDIELVYKVKSNAILERLASSSVAVGRQSTCQELVEEAKENLRKIQDDEFVVNYCMKAQWPTYDTTQEMLNYAKIRILKKEDPISDVLTEVLRAQAKLTTFNGAFGPEKFSGISWIEFLKNEDILKDIFFQLQEGNLARAQYLWLRHRADFESRFDETMLEKLLNSIAATIPVQALCLWFKNTVVPFVRRVVPKGQRILAKWLEQGARNLELTDKANWPENGLQMAEVFFTAKNPDDLGLASSWHWIPLKEYQSSEEVCQLKKLVNSLQELIKLVRKYNCRLALSDFEKENATTIVFRMFDKVLAPELIPSTLTKFIRPYMKEHSLQEEKVLLLYIKELLKCCSSQSASLFETAWEAKAMAVIGCLSDTDLIFDAVLQIMYGAVVPWSAAVEQLVKQHLEMDHPKVKLLQESFKLMEMKKLLRGYGIRDINLLKDKQIMRVVRYILKQDVPSSLEDALKVAQTYMLPNDGVYCLKIIDLIDKERGEECLDLLKSLPPSEVEKTVERLVIWARLALQEHPDSNSEESKSQQMSIAKTLVKCLKILLNIHKGNPMKKDECEKNVKMFETMVSLQEDFDIFLSVEDYGNRSLVTQLREEHIKAYESTRSTQKSGKTQEMTPANTKCPSTESRLYRLALLLQVSEPELGGELALRALNAGKVEKALKICRDLFIHHCNASTGRLLFLACQKLCHMLGADVPMITPAGVNLPAVLHELACQAVTICSPDLLLDALELCKYTLAAMEFYRQCQIDCGFVTKTSFGADKDPYEEWMYNDFFSEDGIVLETQLVLPVIYELISSLVLVTERNMQPLDSASLPYCPFNKGENLLLPVISPISTLLQNLQECSQWGLALGLVVVSLGSCLQHGVSNSMSRHLSEKLYEEEMLTHMKSILTAMKEKANTFIQENASALLHKVFNCRLVDHDLALGYCTLLPKEIVFAKLWKVISNSWQNYNKILAVALVGAQLARLYGEEEIKLKFQELIIDAHWGIRLGKFGISFQPVFRTCSPRKKELIKTLVENPDTDTHLILEYCSTYELDSDSALQLCIETLFLHNSMISPSEETTENTAQRLHSKLLAKAAEIIPLLKSTKDLVISLSGILHKLDPYDYETIEVVLKVIQKADEKNTSIQINQALSLLKHLKSYKRISPPVDLEHQYVLEHIMALSPAAHTRLPFHLIFFGTMHNFWKLLASELSEESFPTLLLISKLMKASLDTLYMSTAKHVFEKKLKPKLLKLAQTNCSTLDNKETAETAQAIQSYLLSIVNPEWAVAIAVKIAQDLPVGPDKISAWKFSLHLAEKWLRNSPAEAEAHDKAEALLKKLRIQYQTSATETVLITHKLNTAEYLKLSGKPAHLIVSLYEHSSIDQRIKSPTGQDYPDIHAAAKEIADINNVNLEKIWDKLLEKWLCPNRQTGEKSADFLDLQGDEEFRRVIYLLQPLPIDYSSRMLYVIATSTSSIGVNQLTFAHRRRALQCLLYSADTETIESVFKKPIEEVKCFLKCITFLAEFENLNIPYTYESFHSSPKEGMIKGLWKNHSHEPMAVRLVAELSLEYKVYDPQLWNGLLQKLLGFNMINYLRNVLAAISSVHSLWQIPYFSKSWQRVILIPLLSASCPPSPTQLQDCCESLVSLLECPVSTDFDVTGVAKQFAQLDLPAFALACLLLMPQSEKKEQQIKNFLDLCNPETILRQVDEHMKTGELAGFASQIRSFILTDLINKKQFGVFTKTEYLPLLKLHMANTNKVKEVVDYLAKENCLDGISTAVIENLKQSGKPIPADTSAFEIVKRYLSGLK
ncbi:kinetochore-associated protein 1 [Tachyglossus aculeatus]|uniref:kinetochore-associated protein 1 n=1 Tax=Tachyglossus aculeatus TaxID=9261 RepID=UPI0018F28BAD|nr:kinetochore-associated protein 1 [Tachyglossus aculeatus]